MMILDVRSERQVLKALIHYINLRCRIDDIDRRFLSQESQIIYDIISKKRDKDPTLILMEMYNRVERFDVDDVDLVSENEANNLIDSFNRTLRNKKFRFLLNQISRAMEKDNMEMEDATGKIMSFLHESSSGFKYVDMKQANMLLKQFHTDVWANKSKKLHWPFRYFNTVLNSLRGKELVVIAGETATGKTSFMLNTADRWAAEGKTIGYISLEIDVVDLKNRIHQKDFDINLSAESEKLSEEGRYLLNDAIDKTVDQKMFFCDSGVRSVHEIIAGIKLMNMLHQFDVVFIDYLQLMSCPGKQSKDAEIGEIMGSLKALAMDIKVPIIIASQLNREVGKNDKGIPKLSNLRESGTIEHSADVVILIYRPILYNKSQSLNEYHAIVAKQRNGKTGTIYMDFNMTRQFIEGTGTSAKCKEELSPSLV